MGLSVSWGNGTRTNAVIEPGRHHRFDHAYLILGNEPHVLIPTKAEPIFL